MSKVCAVCNRGYSQRRGRVEDYSTILQSMGYCATFGHRLCIVKIQQQALQFKGRLVRNG